MFSNEISYIEGGTASGFYTVEDTNYALRLAGGNSLFTKHILWHFHYIPLSLGNLFLIEYSLSFAFIIKSCLSLCDVFQNVFSFLYVSLCDKVLPTCWSEIFFCVHQVVQSLRQEKHQTGVCTYEGLLPRPSVTPTHHQARSFLLLSISPFSVWHHHCLYFGPDVDLFLLCGGHVHCVSFSVKCGP